MATASSEHDSDHLDERTKPPFLRRVRIRGYKSIAFCDVSLQPLTVLVGRNAAGKSNFLDALAFLRDTMETSVTEAVKRRGGWRAIVCRGGDMQKIEFEIEAAFTCGRPYRRVDENGFLPANPAQAEDGPDLEGRTFVVKYNLELSAGSSNYSISNETVEIRDEITRSFASFEAQGGIVTSWRSYSDSTEPLPSPHSRELLSAFRPDHSLLGMIGTQPFIDLAEGLRTMGFYNFHPEAIRRLQKPLRGTLLEKDGSNLAGVIESLKEIDPNSVQRVREYLSTIAEEVEYFDAVKYGEYETVRFHVRSDAAGAPFEFDAASMSDGTLRSLATLMAAFQIHLPIGPSVIGIEEPENALHPAATRILVDALREATGRVQILLTTHSADLLADEDFDPSQLLIVRNRDGRTHITPVDAASREIVRKELYTLGDLQRMDQLELDQADLARQAGLRASNREG